MIQLILSIQTYHSTKFNFSFSTIIIDMLHCFQFHGSNLFFIKQRSNINSTARHMVIKSRLVRHWFKI
jgi:hypothetical protein